MTRGDLIERALRGGFPEAVKRQPARRGAWFGSYVRTLGPLVETFVATELLRQLSWSTNRATLFHFRDRSGIEVDLVLEPPDGRVVGIEVKATSTSRIDHLRGLRFLADRLRDRFTYGYLLTTAPEATPFGNKLAALPISALWDI